MSDKQGKKHKSILKSEGHRRPLLNFLRSAGGNEPPIPQSAQVKVEHQEVEVTYVKQQQPLPPPPPPPSRSIPKTVQQQTRHITLPVQPPRQTGQPIQQQPLQPIPQPKPDPPAQPVMSILPIQPIPAPIQQQPIQVVEHVLQSTFADTGAKKAQMGLEEFTKVQLAIEDQNRVLGVGNAVDGFALGLCLAVLSILFWKLLVKRRKSFTREKFWSLFGYLSFLTTLSCTCFLSAIRSRVRHVSKFIRVAQVPAPGGGQIADINFDWWSGSFDTEITLQVNVILADVMLAYLVHLSWRNNIFVLYACVGLLVMRLVAELFGSPFVFPLLLEIFATTLVAARYAIDKKLFKNDDVPEPSARSVAQSRTDVTDASDVRHITPSVAYVIAAGAFTDLRLFELVAAVTEFGGEDVWQNAVVFVSAFMTQAVIISRWIDGKEFWIDLDQGIALSSSASDGSPSFWSRSRFSPTRFAFDANGAGGPGRTPFKSPKAISEPGT